MALKKKQTKSGPVWVGDVYIRTGTNPGGDPEYKRKRETFYGNRKDAEGDYAEFRRKASKGELTVSPAEQIYLTRLFDEYAQYSKTNHSPNTVKRYNCIVDNFRRYLDTITGITKISDLNLKLFDNYKSFRKSEGAKGKTINVELTCLKTIFLLAIRWGYCKTNPADGITQLREEKSGAPEFLTEDQSKKLLEQADDFMRPILFTLLNSGMRKGELENLTWGDIDLDRRKIKIRYKDTWSPKTSERDIPINDGLLDLLKTHKAQANGCPLVFHRDGQKIEPNHLRKQFMRLTKKCEYSELTSIHITRHTFASNLVMAGVDIPTVQKLMGHSDVQTTMIYSHLSTDHVNRAVEKLNF